MNQSDATLAAEALATECLALQSEVARLRGVIEGVAYAIDAGLSLDKPDLRAGLEAAKEQLRAALQPQPVEETGS